LVDSAKFKDITLNKLCGSLTGKCFEIPNLSYTKRYVAFKADNPEGTNLFNKVGSPASPIGTDE
jgi:hypothetical protein